MGRGTRAVRSRGMVDDMFSSATDVPPKRIRFEVDQSLQFAGGYEASGYRLQGGSSSSTRGGGGRSQAFGRGLADREWMLRNQADNDFKRGSRARRSLRTAVENKHLLLRHQPKSRDHLRPRHIYPRATPRDLHCLQGRSPQSDNEGHQGEHDGFETSQRRPGTDAVGPRKG